MSAAEVMMDSSFLSRTCQLLVIGKTRAQADEIADALPDAEFQILYRPTDELSQVLETEWIDVVIIDATIPQKTARAICRRIRRNPRAALVPILLFIDDDLTDEARVECLREGADDFMSLKQRHSVMTGRIKALVRREAAERALRESPPLPDILRVGQLTIKLASYEVLRNNESIQLSLGEFRLLTLLASRPNHVFHREQIRDVLAGEESPDDFGDRSLESRVYTLRRKLGPLSHYIKNARGIGFTLRAI